MFNSFALAAALICTATVTSAGIVPAHSQVDRRVTAAGCPPVHVFGARETTARPGFGRTSTVVNLILKNIPGSTSEAIDYPACLGTIDCGFVSYPKSVQAGTDAVTKQVTAFNQKCPDTQLVLVGYSQGAQISDNVLCGGGDLQQGVLDRTIPISPDAVDKVKAAVFMGNPRFTNGQDSNAGSCKSNGFDPRPANFDCPAADKIKSFCDNNDIFCCGGASLAVHLGYGPEFGNAAFDFIKTKLDL